MYLGFIQLYVLEGAIIMKKLGYGKIFKLNRKIKGCSLEYVVDKCTKLNKGIKTVSQLSKIENQLGNVRMDQLKDLYSILEIDFIESKQSEINELVERNFKEILDLILHDKDYSNEMKEMNDYEEIIKTSFSYPKYILINLYTKKYDHLPIDQQKKICLMLFEYEEYLEDYQKQLLYDYIGQYYLNKYKYHKAILYFTRGIKIINNNHIAAYIMYHKAIACKYTNNVQEALVLINKSRNYFNEKLLYKKSLHCSIETANIYTRLEEYNRAEELLNMIENGIADYQLEYLLPDVYKYKAWNYACSKQYEKLKETCLKIIESDRNNQEIYFFLAWAFYHLNDSKQAIYYLKELDKYPKTSLPYLKRLTYIFARYIKDDCNQITIERDLLSLLQSLERQKFDTARIKFVYQFILEFYNRFNLIENENKFLKKYMNYLNTYN